MTRGTQDGATTYTVSPNGLSGNTYTTRLDPGKNKAVDYFTGGGLYRYGVAPVLTEVQQYQNTGTVASPVYAILTTDIYCYNGNTTNCQTAGVSYPITQKDSYHTPGAMTTSSRVSTTYDKYGNVTSVAEYDFGASSPTTTTTAYYGSWTGALPCAAVGSGVFNVPCDIVTTDNAGHTLSETRLTYNSQGFKTASSV